MIPILLRIPLPGGHEIALPAYGTFLVLGLLAAVWVSGRRPNSLGLDRRGTFDLGFFLVVSGVLGARLLDLVIYRDVYFGRSDGSGLSVVASAAQGGLVYYGGLVGGFLCLVVWAHFKRKPLADVADFVAPLVILALGVTRIGCFLNGCCFGIPADLPWAVVYPIGSHCHLTQVGAGLTDSASSALAVHPAQLYELGAALAIYAFLFWRQPRRRFPWQITAEFLILYGVWRFFVEFLRADAPGWPEPEGLLGWTPYQWMSLALVGVGGLLWWMASRRWAR